MHTLLKRHCAWRSTPLHRNAGSLYTLNSGLGSLSAASGPLNAAADCNATNAFSIIANRNSLVLDGLQSVQWQPQQQLWLAALQKAARSLLLIQQQHPLITGLEPHACQWLTQLVQQALLLLLTWAVLMLDL